MVKIKELLELVKDMKCFDELEKFYQDKLDQEIKIPGDEELKKYLDIIEVLANPLRLKILALISQQELPVCMLTKITGKEQSLISHHLSLLRERGLARVRVAGKFRYYKFVGPKWVKQLLDLIVHGKEFCK